MYKTRCISQTRFVRATIDGERVWTGLLVQQSSERPIKSYNSQSARGELSWPRLGIDRAALGRNIYEWVGLYRFLLLDNLWSVWCFCWLKHFTKHWESLLRPSRNEHWTEFRSEIFQFVYTKYFINLKLAGKSVYKSLWMIEFGILVNKNTRSLLESLKTVTIEWERRRVYPIAKNALIN